MHLLADSIYPCTFLLCLLTLYPWECRFPRVARFIYSHLMARCFVYPFLCFSHSLCMFLCLGLHVRLFYLCASPFLSPAFYPFTKCRSLLLVSSLFFSLLTFHLHSSIFSFWVMRSRIRIQYLTLFFSFRIKPEIKCYGPAFFSATVNHMSVLYSSITL